MKIVTEKGTIFPRLYNSSITVTSKKKISKFSPSVYNQTMQLNFHDEKATLSNYSCIVAQKRKRSDERKERENMLKRRK